MIEILIIDDHTSILDMLKRRLAKFEYVVNVCSSVEEAKRFLFYKSVDLILIDYMMPEISGFDFFISYENKNEVPVIMMTAHATINLVTEFIKNGGADFIEKPIDIDILHMKMQRAIYNNQRLNIEKAQRIKAEEELKISYQTLQEKSALLELANSQLESFAGVVAHDLRSPLSGQKMMLGYLFNKAKEIDNGLIDNTFISSIALLKNNNDEMLLLVNALLEFSKLNKEGFKLQKVNAEKIVQEIVATNKSNLKIQFKIDVQHEIEAEPTLIKQVFANLIQNAIKYSATKETQVIEISSEKNEKEIVFSIKDNGIGFKMENANKIFSMFSRLETEEEFEGTGVGLAIVKNIINRHNGKIWANSVIGEGSNFFFTIPV